MVIPTVGGTDLYFEATEVSGKLVLPPYICVVLFVTAGECAATRDAAVSSSGM